MRYRVHRIKEPAGEAFRWSSHMGGTAVVKAKDYDAAEELDGATPYAAWKLAASRERPLHPGDVLEALDEDGNVQQVLIAKYIGFEPAEWFVPALKPELASTAQAAAQD